MVTLNENSDNFTSSNATVSVLTKVAEWKCNNPNGWIVRPGIGSVREMILNPQDTTPAEVRTGTMEIWAENDKGGQHRVMELNLGALGSLANQKSIDYRWDWDDAAIVAFGSHLRIYINSATAVVGANCNWALPVVAR